MSNEKKYLKYKNKYLKLKKLIGGTSQEDINDIINHTFLVSAVDVASSMIPSEGLLDLHLHYKGKIEDEITSPLEHSYPTIHSAFGTLVYSHRNNIWDFNELAIINKMSIYNGNIYKMNPYDTMIISNRINVDNDTIVIISSRFKESEDENSNWRKWLGRIDPSNIVYFDDSFKNNIKNGDGSLNVNKVLSSYNTETHQNNLSGTTFDIMKKYIDKMTEYMKITSRNTYMKALFDEQNLIKLYPTILSRVLFNECLRDTINKTIKEITPEGSYTYKNIYCNNNQRETRFSDPKCLRKISNSSVDTSDVFIANSTDIELKKDSPHEGEDSIYGIHHNSLLDKHNTLYNLNDLNTVQNVLNLIDQYSTLLKRKFLKINLPNSSNIIAVQIVGLILKKKREAINSTIRQENEKIKKYNNNIKKEILPIGTLPKNLLPIDKIVINDEIISDEIISLVTSLIKGYIDHKNDGANVDQINDYTEALTYYVKMLFDSINKQLEDLIENNS